jgi:acetyl/propionyl-CoA carboxylase alpha subunit
MQKYEIPDKLIRLSKLCITQAKGKIKIENDHSESFRIHSGVRQGDGLSPMLEKQCVREQNRQTCRCSWQQALLIL